MDFEDDPRHSYERYLAPLYWITGRLTSGDILTSTDPDFLLRAVIGEYDVPDGGVPVSAARQRKQRTDFLYTVAKEAQLVVNKKTKTAGAFRKLPEAVQNELLEDKTKLAGEIVSVWRTSWPLLVLNAVTVKPSLRQRTHPTVNILDPRTDHSFLMSLKSIGMLDEWGGLFEL